MSTESPIAGDQPLETWLRERHSCRAFLPEPVPRAVIERILALAQRTASWCNCQPWQVAVTEGAATERLRQALLARAEEPGFTPDFPFPAEYRDAYLARRREAGFNSMAPWAWRAATAKATAARNCATSSCSTRRTWR